MSHWLSGSKLVRFSSIEGVGEARDRVRASRRVLEEEALRSMEEEEGEPKIRRSLSSLVVDEGVMAIGGAISSCSGRGQRSGGGFHGLR